MNPRAAIAAARALLARAPRAAKYLPRGRRRRAFRAVVFDLDLALALAAELVRRPYEPPAILESVIVMEENPEP